MIYILAYMCKTVLHMYVRLIRFETFFLYLFITCNIYYSLISCDVHVFIDIFTVIQSVSTKLLDLSDRLKT